jgi:small subunit ribosomal protein S16
MGTHKSPYYRVVVCDSRNRRDGRFLEIVGNYNPLKEPSEINLDADKVRKWLSNGAQPTNTVKRLIRKAGIQPA